MSEHELWNELGNLYFLSGSYVQAVYAYSRSIQLDESFGRPYSNLALTYVQQGKYGEAVDLYRRSIELLMEDKEKAITWNRLGNVYRYLKDYKQALVAYQRADELDPENAEGHEEPGWIAEPGRPAMSDSQARPGSAATRLTEKPQEAEIKPTPAADLTQVTELSTAGAISITEAPQAEASMPEDEAPDNSTATWEEVEPAPYQADVSEAMDAGSLTMWGESNPEPAELDADFPFEDEDAPYVPADDEDEMTRWLPLPEDSPLDDLEFALDDLELPADLNEPERVAVEMPVERRAEPEAMPSESPKASPVPIVALLPAHSSVPSNREGAEPTQKGIRLDVIVQERPTPEFVMGAEQAAEPVAEKQASTTQTLGEIQSKPEARLEQAPLSVGATEVTTPQRDADEMREIEAGLAKFKRVVQINPRNARAWDTLGNLYKTAGQYKEALLAYQQAIANDPSKALYHHHLGLVYACEGRIEDTIDAFQRVIEIDPDHGLAHAALAGYYRKMGLEELAQKHVGIAMKSIFDSENEYNRACLAAICGNTDQALDLLRVALKNKQTYVDWILRDPDLDFIRQDPRFKQLISDYAR